MEKIQLFVPGRLCLLGEHSDWAGLYSMINSNIVPGEAIVTGIEQGIYAEVEKDERFIIESAIKQFSGERFECDMEAEKLRKTAKQGGFFSYVAGVASYLKEHFNTGGLKVTITKMDLPIKSGLSSSAAICVLVTRAFNRLYKLKLNTMGEMQIAYMGEQRTPSRCGRLDQACAYGKHPVHMVFEGNEISVTPLTVKKPMYWVIADLKASKDTIQILSDLNSCYPFPKDEGDNAVQEALGIDNHVFVEKAKKFIELGECEELGRLMTEFQENFDKKVAPACPEQLTAPVLHSVLEDSVVKQLTYGAKGVGSQGDGTAQFLARSEEAQNELIEYLNESYKFSAFSLTLSPHCMVKRAVIPLAGFGTRMFPASKIVKKDFLPILDQDGVVKPVLFILLEQLVEAGIAEICLVIGKDEQHMYDEFFADLNEENYSKLPQEKKKYQDMISQFRNRITYVYQSERKGLGHAVYQCREFTKDEPVLLLLGDMIYKTYENRNCMKQMIDAYQETGCSLISMHQVQEDEVIHYGIMHGKWDDKEHSCMTLNEIAEKPSVKYAQEYLAMVNDKGQKDYYAVFGQYILTSAVFEQLEIDIRENKLQNGEIQLTTALEQVRVRQGMRGIVINGKSFDVGLPTTYANAMATFHQE